MGSCIYCGLVGKRVADQFADSVAHSCSSQFMANVVKVRLYISEVGIKSVNKVLLYWVLW